MRFATLIAIVASGCSVVSSLSGYRFADDGGIDAPSTPMDGGTDACVSTEVCNGRDDNCNGSIDEGFDLTTDPANCGGCGSACDGVFCRARTCIHAVQLSVGENFSCALLTGGEVWCWGQNGLGQLGDGMTMDRSSPAQVGGLPPIAYLSAGAGHACAVSTDRTLYCWGDNRHGEIGIGSVMTPQPVPELVSFADAESVVAGSGYTCARDHFSGSLRCWGTNTLGQLGSGDTAPQMAPPTAATLVDVRATYDAYSHTCVATSTELMCWGDNRSGQLGTGAAPVLRPTSLTVGSAVGSVGIGNAHTCIALTDGTVRCLGYNRDGQLGDGSTMDSTIPVAVADLASVDVLAVTGQSACALADGTVWCWGDNAFGQVGQPGADALRVQQVPALTATLISGGGRTLCAVSDSGAVICWGANDSGQLGRGFVSPSMGYEGPGEVVWP